MMKTVGMIGGLGWESSATYYRVMNQEVRRVMGGWHCARVILDSLDFHEFAVAERAADFVPLRRQLVESAQRLEAAGAEILLVACNTVHRFASEIESSVGLPFLHIADASARVLRGDGHRRVALLGTSATMEGDFYKQTLANHELDVVVPDKDDRMELNRLILEDLNQGSPSVARVSWLDAMIGRCAEEGATAVLLACTELGLALGDKDEAKIERRIPAYDSAVIHALAAVQASLGGAFVGRG